MGNQAQAYCLNFAEPECLDNLELPQLSTQTLEFDWEKLDFTYEAIFACCEEGHFKPCRRCVRDS